MDSQTDILWKAFAESGSTDSFKQLFEASFDPMCRYCLFFTSDRMDAEEVVLDFFLHLWKRRSDISVQKSFDSYAKSALHNRCLNKIRSRKKSECLDEASDASVEGEYEFDSRTLMDIVWEGATSIPAKCQDIFRLSREEGLTYAQIAERTGLSEKSVEGYMTRALKYMRVAMKKLRLFVLLFYPVVSQTFTSGGVYCPKKISAQPLPSAA